MSSLLHIARLMLSGIFYMIIRLRGTAASGIEYSGLDLLYLGRLSNGISGT